MIPDQTSVIVISSHVARGSVGNRAAVFALEALGFPVWAVPTVLLPWHPGHGIATRIIPEPNQFAALLKDLASSPWLGEIGAVLSGYLGDARQAGAVANLVKAAKERNPDVVYVCDPVIGDNGGLYVKEDIAVAIRDTLIPVADLVTPNIFEFEWLSGRKPESLEDIAAMAGNFPRSDVLVTSASSGERGRIGNLLTHGGSALFAGHPLIDHPPKGAGDLLAALFLGQRLRGLDSEQALSKATASVYEVLTGAHNDGCDELALEAHAECLRNPALSVSLTLHHTQADG